MKEKEYDIRVIELSERIVSVPSTNIDNALDNVEGMYNREEIVLDYNDCCERRFENLYSKKLEEDFNININFKNGILTIQNDSNQKETYSCDTVRHIGNCLAMFTNDYMENHDIDSKEGHQIEIDLVNEKEMDMDI